MAWHHSRDRREVIRYLIYTAVLLVLWGLLIVDILFLLGYWDGFPPLYVITAFYLVVVGYTIGPVIAVEARSWRKARREAAKANRPWEGYQRVALICYGCGWQRMIGYTGQLGKSRALIHIRPAKSPCNVLSAVVLKVPSDEPIEKQLSEYPYFREIGRDAHAIGLIRALHPYRNLLRHKPCPRCKRAGKIHVHLWSVYRDDNPEDLARHRSWRLINKCEAQTTARG